VARNIRWRLVVFDAQAKRVLAPIILTDEQAAALKPYLGGVYTDAHFGRYPVVSAWLFAEEQAE